MKLGYFLSNEECYPKQLVELAKRAEDAGFHALWISDHYHPWIDEQGHSPFVWSAIGAIAVEVLRLLWEGGQQSYRGRHYRVENARIYDLPENPVEILVSGFGPKSVELAAKIGDGYVTTSPDEDMIKLYRGEGGTGPIQAGTKVCFDSDEKRARETAHRIWQNEQPSTSSSTPGRARSCPASTPRRLDA